MLRKVLCACALSLLSFGCSHGTWVVKPEGSAKVRDWKYETFMPWMVPVMGHMVSPGDLAWVHITAMRPSEGGIVLDTDRGLRLISPQKGRLMHRWSPPLHLRRTGRYSGPQPYGDALYSLIEP